VGRLEKGWPSRLGNAVPTEEDAHVRSQAAGTIHDRPQQQPAAAAAAAWRPRLDRIDGDSALVADGEGARRSSESLIRLVVVVAQQMWWRICSVGLVGCWFCYSPTFSNMASRSNQKGFS